MGPIIIRLLNYTNWPTLAGEVRLDQENAHPIRSCKGEAGFGVLQNSVDLAPLDPFKPVDELFDRSTGFQVLEKSGNWNSRSFEKPGPTNFSRDSLNRVARTPADHLLNNTDREPSSQLLRWKEKSDAWGVALRKNL